MSAPAPSGRRDLIAAAQAQARKLAATISGIEARSETSRDRRDAERASHRAADLLAAVELMAARD